MAAIDTMLASRELASPGQTKTQTSYRYETTYSSNLDNSGYSSNIGNDMGMPTVGFRSAKFNPPEWHETNYAKYYQSFADRDSAEKTKHYASDIIKETEALSIKTQTENTKKIAERLKDINFWKTELHREINDMISETDLLVAQKKRLENALKAFEIPHHIATDNLNCRLRRQGVDLVQDDVELELLKEVEVINNAQDLLRRTIKEAELQIKRNRDHKQNLEMDWSDKKEAEEIDSFCANLRNEHTCKQFYPGAARFQEIQSTPESWAQFTHDNIARAENERLASIQLRALIDNVIQDTSRDVKEQADAVDAAFRRRVAEVEEAKRQMEEHLKKICDTITDAERAIEDIKRAIKAKEDPMKVAQTRLHQREFRPNVELCRDPAQFGLVSEVHQLAASTDALLQQLREAENRLRELQDQRMALEKDISIKKNTLFIDREKCMTHRTRYPSITKLQGF